MAMSEKKPTVKYNASQFSLLLDEFNVTHSMKAYISQIIQNIMHAVKNKSIILMWCPASIHASVSFFSSSNLKKSTSELDVSNESVRYFSIL